ncbi:MAG: hypothetical protein HQ538_00290 [Parcubacteria group bacterium]|nr:hypothetical protein [Parcubacteria group bacterium]
MNEKLVHISYKQVAVNLSLVLTAIKDFLLQNNYKKFNYEYWGKDKKITLEDLEKIQYQEFVLDKNNRLSINVEVEMKNISVNVHHREIELYFARYQNLLIDDPQKKEIIFKIFIELGSLYKATRAVFANLINIKAVQSISEIEIVEYSNDDLNYLLKNISEAKSNFGASGIKVFDYLSKKSKNDLNELFENLLGITTPGSLIITVKVKPWIFLREFIFIYSYYALSTFRSQEKGKSVLNYVYDRVKIRKENLAKYFFRLGVGCFIVIFLINIWCAIILYLYGELLPSYSMSHSEYIKSYFNFFIGKTPIIIIEFLFLYLGIFFVKRYSMYSKIIELYECYTSLIESDNYYDNYPGSLSNESLSEVRKDFLSGIVLLSSKVQNLIENHEKSSKPIKNNIDLATKVLEKIIKK